MRNISIKELNQFFMKHYEDKMPHAYQFANIVVAQYGNIIYSPMDISAFLTSEFTIVKLSSYKYKLIGNINKSELNTFLRGITPLTNMVMNFNL